MKYITESPFLAPPLRVVACGGQHINTGEALAPLMSGPLSHALDCNCILCVCTRKKMGKQATA